MNLLPGSFCSIHVNLTHSFVSKEENRNHSKNIRRHRIRFSRPGFVCPWPTISMYNGHLGASDAFQFVNFVPYPTAPSIPVPTRDLCRFRIIRFFNREENLLFHVRLYSWRRWTEVCKQQTLPNDGGICIAVSSVVIQSNTN